MTAQSRRTNRRYSPKSRHATTATSTGTDAATDTLGGHILHRHRSLVNSYYLTGVSPVIIIRHFAGFVNNSYKKYVN